MSVSSDQEVQDSPSETFADDQNSSNNTLSVLLSPPLTANTTSLASQSIMSVVPATPGADASVSLLSASRPALALHGRGLPTNWKGTPSAVGAFRTPSSLAARSSLGGIGTPIHTFIPQTPEPMSGTGLELSILGKRLNVCSTTPSMTITL